MRNGRCFNTGSCFPFTAVTHHFQFIFCTAPPESLTAQPTSFAWEAGVSLAFGGKRRALVLVVKPSLTVHRTPNGASLSPPCGARNGIVLPVFYDFTFSIAKDKQLCRRSAAGEVRRVVCHNRCPTHRPAISVHHHCAIHYWVGGVLWLYVSFAFSGKSFGQCLICFAPCFNLCAIYFLYTHGVALYAYLGCFHCVCVCFFSSFF